MTPVIFRQSPDGEVIALFPATPADTSGSLCSSYQHVGQHGAANDLLVVTTTKLAKPEEYADLLAELVSIGYDDLKIYKRVQQWMYDARKAAARR